ncbi:small heat shock protein, chloroplastic [Vigna radiata var. radiata]|uniref:Small heat shock protein, chloroplastic n=1 Tax=Vigna radiata var. radiata TaxID=3916 RepID=A0A1S3VQC3_VIGRR|nr:small heat shock protein, chloroplastic [Vigna radiata var. radiata]
METELVKRRIHMIAAHFASKDDTSATHVLPMNCSGSLNSVLRRCDNKVYFARQASSSLGYFMRQTSIEEGGSTFAPKTHHGAAAASEYSSNARAPCFARPAVAESLSKNSVVQSQTPEQGFDTLDPPTFARPNRQTRGDQLHSEKKTCYSEIGGIEWSPRMDVAESESKYVITVEVPGVSISDIRVEVDDLKLCVKGRRSASSWTISSCPNSSFSSYHRREILYGPYEVVWQLPSGVNKDRISAEFLDGLLQIVVPKTIV